MRIEANIPPSRPAVIVRRVVACDPVCAVRQYLLPRLCAHPMGEGPIPFSRYLEKHNREDRVDLSRAALPPFADAPGAPAGGTLDILA